MKEKQLRNYFIITFAFSWILWIPFVLPTFGLYEMNEILEGLLMLAVMIGAFGPLLAAVILVGKAEGKSGLKAYFKRCFDWRVHWKYYIAAIALGLIITMIAHYFTNLTGMDSLPNNLIPEGINLPVYVLIIPYTIMLLFLGGGQEEFGWRGYAQDPMQEKYGVIKGSLIIGVFWGLWHAPLWLIEGEGHGYYPFLAFMLYIISWSLIIGLLYNLSGKKMMIPWIMHTIGNLSVPLFPVLFLENVPQPGYWVWAIMNLIAAVLFAYYFHNRVQNKTIMN